MTLLTKILIGVVALALGVLLGLPGRQGPGGPRAGRWTVHRADGDDDGPHSEEDLLELEDELGKEWGRSKTAKRHFTLINWARKDQRASHRRRARRHFRTAAPKRPKR